MKTSFIKLLKSANIEELDIYKDIPKAPFK
jgi:hypothetical protein